MHPGTLVFCEASGNWASAWRRESQVRAERVGCDLQQVPVVETRSVTECREAIESLAGGFLAIELTPPKCEAVLDLLLHLGQQGKWPAAVLADRDMKAYEWLARELGAVHFVTSHRGLAALSPCVRRYFEPLPGPAMGTAERIWSMLPWEN
jgi:hypothetical protein